MVAVPSFMFSDTAARKPRLIIASYHSGTVAALLCRSYDGVMKSNTQAE